MKQPGQLLSGWCYLIWIVLPAYNEALSIEPLFSKFAEVANDLGAVKVLLVDDGSSDATAEKAEEVGKQLSLPVEVVRHEVNSGLGRAIKTGLTTFLSRSKDGDFCCTMDCDNTQPPKLLKEMLTLAEQNNLDIVVASRYQRGSGVKGLSAFRVMLSQGASVLFQAIAPIPGIKDYTCGYRLYRRSFLEKLTNTYGEQLFTQEGFSCMADLLLKSRRLHPRAAEVAMLLRYDEKLGQSKMKVLKTIGLTLDLLFKHLLERVS
ncbi:MAG: glycosyltransferase family 2 protein [Cyanobacteria bacterium SZAS-4]|nr:glycosyltransferase family 2 protein [Cyanobacteria bacterium SZAS-4]